jgi:YidC/Oxa1 family membrane protein insertase
MERRFVIFLILSFGILLGSSWLMQRLYPPRPRPQWQERQVAAGKAGEKAKPPAAEKERPRAVVGKPDQGNPAAKAEKEAPPALHAAAEPEAAEQWVTLGSASDTDPYRMLVTLDSRGAALARIELSSQRYCDIDDRSGYLGHLVMDSSVPANGCPVQIVGPGTPAAEAKLQVGDVIKAVDGKIVSDRQSLEALLRKTKPKQTVQLSVVRAGKNLTLSATLRRRPLEVIKPEGDDPLSMLATLQQFDGQRLLRDEPKKEGKEADKDKANEKDTAEEKESLHKAFLDRELDGVKLRTVNWKLVASDATHAQFRRLLPEKGLEITKTYRLAKVPGASLTDANYPAYHLEFEIEIRNVGSKPHKVAYRLDGPNGLPTEGKWYATRVTRSGGSGLRDFIVSFGGGTPGMVGATYIATGKIPPPWSDEALTFIGVDAQYFSAVLMPDRADPGEVWFEELLPIRVGAVDPQHTNLANSSCRLIGKAQQLKPGGAITNRFKLFAGPKKASILQNDEYRLGELVYFGWPIFAWVAAPLTAILHGFYAVVGNYGLAIILLTVFVRGCMFPISRKQAMGMKKMQELQPEIKKIQEKYKNNTEGRTKAQQELFRKHNYNPLSGCLPIFIQMPIFIGLWRTLSVAIELRDAPLFSQSIRWCSNLAAPDMLYDWSWFMPAFVSSGMGGIFSLGPYFNLLPILGVILTTLQQRMYMPPPADEQAAMQQKVMQYMMVFMGLMFYKFASGLCIYFIVQSLWGFVERKFLPKAVPVAAGGPETRAEAKAREKKLADAAALREEAARAKKNRGKK